MEGLSWKCLLLVVIGLCHVVLSTPIPQETDSLDVNPLTLDENNYGEGLERQKRKLPEAGFAAKNAILGYVFGKIDGILDAKTRLITTLDQTNIAKNKQYGIEAPKPITSLQSLIQAVISPKIAAITSKFGALSGGASSGSTGFSLSGGAGADAGASVSSEDEDDAGLSAGAGASAGGASAGVGGLLSSFLKLSGPILSSSSSSAKGGGAATVATDDDSEE